jgi:hypothetical protein
MNANREFVDIPDAWRAFAEHAGITNVPETWRAYAAWMEDRGHELSDRTWSAWVRRRPKQPKTASKPVYHPACMRPNPDWERDRATPGQALAALAAMAEGKVWLVCGHTTEPSPLRGLLPKCPHGCDEHIETFEIPGHERNGIRS